VIAVPLGPARATSPGCLRTRAANAVPADADSFDATDWNQILALYDQLLEFTPTPVVTMNRAIALAEVQGPQAALDILDGLALDGYHLFHAARADLLRRVGRQDDARRAYAHAANLATSDAERSFLMDRLEPAQPAG